MPTQMTLPSLDALREAFAATDSPTESTPAPKAPEAPKAGNFRRGATASAKAAPEPKASVFKPNAYAGDCIHCGGHVPANAGLRDRRDGRWVVFHVEGGCPEVRVTDAEGNTTVLDPQDRPVEIDARNPRPGIYTVEDADGHVTLKVWQQPMSEDFAPGTLIVEHLVGRDNENDYLRFAFIKEGRLQVWKKHRVDEGQPERRYVRAARVLLEDPESVLESVHCFRCNERLSNPDSVKAGLGPDCRAAWGV